MERMVEGPGGQRGDVGWSRGEANQLKVLLLSRKSETKILERGGSYGAMGGAVEGGRLRIFQMG